MPSNPQISGRYAFQQLAFGVGAASVPCTAMVRDERQGYPLPDFTETRGRVRVGLELRLRRMIFSRGGYHDEILFGLTAEEFAAAPWSKA